MRIQHNLAAVNSNRMLGNTSVSKQKSSEKLSSGYKINRAADGAAELSISEKMRKQIRGLGRGIDNIGDGVSMCKIMDGALHEVNDMLQRMNELSIQAANGTLSDTDRLAIENEIGQLKKEINRISSTTRFNEIYPLRTPDKVVLSDAPPLEITQAGADIVFAVDNTGSMGGMIRNVASNLSSFANNLDKYNVRYGVIAYGDLNDSSIKTYPMVDSLDELSANLNDTAAHLTGGGDGPESTLDGIMAAINNYDYRPNVAKEIIVVTDADYHTKETRASSSQFLESDVLSAIEASGVRVSVVTNSNYMNLYSKLANGKVLNMNSQYKEELNSLTSDIGKSAAEKSSTKTIIPVTNDAAEVKIHMSGKTSDYSHIHTYHVSTFSLRIDDVCCLTSKQATDSIDIVSYALQKISDMRSQIGAEQNGLEHAEKVNGNTRENTTAGESRLRDTDMAEEMVKLSMQNILEQAGQSMLAQANQTPQGVMSLLQVQ